MCLIVSGKASKVRATLLDTHGLLSDIYTSNSDGIGFMYGSANGLRVVKYLPKSLADAVSFVRRMPNDDRDIAIHFRYTTHGDTDLLNCHPYDVIPGFVAMMHNGVLHTGNNADKTKSDTWHFIKDYLHSSVRQAPGLVHDHGFMEMVGEFIGNNRFVFMDGDGKMSIVNKDQGVEYDGMWFSNTYAWRPNRLIPTYQSNYKYNFTARGYTSYYAQDEDEYDDHYSSWTGNVKSLHPQEAASKKLSAHDPRWSEDDSDWQEDADSYEVLDIDPPKVDELEQVMCESEVEMLEDWIAVYPAYTLRMLFGHMQPVKTQSVKDEDLAMQERAVYQSAFSDDVDRLIDIAQSSDHARAVLVETLCYYMYWRLRMPAKQPVSMALTTKQ